MRRWSHALILTGSALAAGVASGQSAGPGVVPEGRETPPELAALQADLSEEETAKRLQAISAEKQRLLQRTEVRGRAYVRLVRVGLLPLSDGFKGFVAHANRVEALRRALARDLAAVAKLDRDALAAREGLRQLRAGRDRVVRQANDYQRSRDAILAAKEREAAYRRAFQSKGKASEHTAVYVSTSDADGVDTFPELKGHVPFPVEGRAEVRELEPTAERGSRVQMLVEIGAIARSVFKGRVVLVRSTEDGTQAVVLDHGKGYTTLTGNLRRVLVSVGDRVAAGAELGELGLGDQGRAMLDFEVRHDGVNLLPAEWFGI